MFEFLFKFPPEIFDRGSLILALPAWQLALLPLAIFICVLALLGYWRLGRQMPYADLVAIAVLRSLALSLLLFSLSLPLLEVSARVPQPGVVGVLLDNSVSMQLDHGSGTRSDFIKRQFDDVSGPLLQDLRKAFEVRLFAFGAATRHVDSVEALDFADGDSDLGQALRFVTASLQGEPLAGLVVVSDGAAQSMRQLEATLLSLRAAGTPLFTIGVGDSRYRKDIEIASVEVPRQVSKGSRVNARLQVRQQGYDGKTVELLVEDDSRILYRQALMLEPGEQALEIALDTEDAGTRQLEFRLATGSGEGIEDNNSRGAVMSVAQRKSRVLYYEGEPRFEFKFVRRALAEEEQVALTGLVRTADAKFYRVGIESARELRNGFPITRDELFSYEALILGSVELTLLSREQQEMIVEFVSQRGGSLLLLGGRQAFVEGGYHDSLLANILPVVLEARAQPGFARDIRLLPSEAALVHPALQLADSSEQSMARWLTLPPLTIVNPIRKTRPGATLLLAGSPADGEEPLVAMAFQRYGRGKVVAFPVQNSWLWQMHQDIDLDDQSHERLWRQLLRWLTEGVPGRLELTLSSHEVHLGGSIGLRSEVRRADFSADTDARPQAVVTAPSGLERVVGLMQDPSLQGVYTAEISAGEPGDYLVRVELEQQDGEARAIDPLKSRFRVTPQGGEYYRSEMNPQLLSQIATRTGGSFLAADDTRGLVDALDRQQRGSPQLLRHELWDMPVIFLLLVLLLLAEWSYRRWRGLI